MLYFYIVIYVLSSNFTVFWFKRLVLIVYNDFRWRVRKVIPTHKLIENIMENKIINFLLFEVSLINFLGYFLRLSEWNYLI